MESLCDIFGKNEYSLTFHPEDYKSFYYCLYSATHDSGQPVRSENASQMQTDIYEFERKNAMYFHLFQPKYVVCDGNHSAEDCLKWDLEEMRKGKKPPSPRECFAAADLLQRCIYIVICNHTAKDNNKKLRGYIFAHTNKNYPATEPICILMLENQNGSVQFANIRHNGDLTMDLTLCLGTPMNKEHKHCFGLRFANDFSLLFDGDVSYGKKNDVKDLYRRLSLEFYGTEKGHTRILNIICNFELHPDNLELFCKFVDNTITEETSLNDKQRILDTNVGKVRNQPKSSGECEFYALSSVYNVDIIVDKSGRGEWERYMSVVCTYANCFDSPIILRTQKSEGEGCYAAYVTHPDACSCCQNIPEIRGHIGEIKANIHEAVLKNPCCPAEGRRYNHTHLKHLPNIRRTWPECIPYAMPTDDITMVVKQLKEEDRLLDQINGGNGSLAKAMAKELYGKEDQYFARDLQNAIGGEQLDFNTKMLNLSRWLNVPIYVYCGVSKSCQCCFWTKFEQANTALPLTKNDCRFYVTLFYNNINGSFDRITPAKGCNCQIPAPLSLLRNTYNMEIHSWKPVRPEERHHPLVTFLTDEPNIEMFKIEIRQFLGCSSFSSINIVKQRSDMVERTLDYVEGARYSLFRCLSKDIFGTGKHFNLLLKELSNELMQNLAQYLPFIGDDTHRAFTDTMGKIEENKKGYEKLATFIKQRIEDELPCGELLLWIACTFLQTPIYVLRITDRKTSTESFWTEYANKRLRKNRRNATSFEQKCLKSRRYYITLLDTGYMQYHRIVPKQQVCNCVLEIPEVPKYIVDTTEYHTKQDCRLMREIRKIDNQLKGVCILIDQWLFCNQKLQEKCDVMILEIEGRRKNVNIATITGTSVGIIGAALTGVGFALAPFTAGISTLLSVGGAVLAVSGGTVATGAKITESVLNNDTIETLKRYQNCYQENVENLNSAMRQLKEDLKKLGDISKEMQASRNLEASDFADVQSIPGVVRAVKGLLMIPLSVLKVSSRGILILGAIIGPITAIVDATLLVFSAHNMAKGNKTDVTENLRRLSASLYGSRRQMHNWAYGNQKPFTYA